MDCGKYLSYRSMFGMIPFVVRYVNAKHVSPNTCMARLAADRDTHLTPAEIAEEALRQFDSRSRPPSIRSLATALRVAPTAIYHHFPSQAAIYQAVVERVWGEATMRLLELMPKPLEADPKEVLVGAALATRRTWIAHYGVAPYMAATPEANEFTANALGLMANLFERMGVEGEAAASAFHSYASFMLGSTMFAANRTAANEQLEGRNGAGGRVHLDRRPRGHASKRTRLSIDEVTDLSVVDPDRDEELFEQGLRALIDTMVPPRRRAPRKK